MFQQTRSGPLPVALAILAFCVLTASERIGQAAPNGCNFTGNINWWYSENGYDTKMQPINDWFCWLTTLEGNWDGSSGQDQGVSVEIEQDGFWHLITRQGGDHGQAYCQQASCFEGANPGFSVEWDNRNYPNNFWNESSISNTCGMGGCDHESNNNGWSGISGTQSSLTMLQGWPLLSGATNGNGEGAGVNNNPGSPHTLWTQSCVNNQGCAAGVEAVFSSIFVGTLNTNVPVYPYVTGWSTGTADADLHTDAATGICYITYVAGAFRGNFPGGSYAHVYLRGTEWHLGTGRGSSGGDPSANFACMAYKVNH